MDEVLNRNAVTSAASYAVIQFASNDGGAVSIVNTQWLTPRRCEVYWPPIKGSKAFDRILSSVDASPDEKWKLYGVQRVFYETGSLIEAKMKLKLSEFTSDLEIAEETSQKRLTKRTKLYILSESESDDDRHVRPPQVKKKFVNRLSIKDHQDQPTPLTAENIVSNCTINENSSLLNNKDDLPLLSSSVLQGLEHELRQTNSQESLWLEGTPPQKSEQYYGNAKQSSATTCSSTLTGFQSKVLSLLSIIKTQNEQMLELLKRSRDIAAGTLKPEFKFPLNNAEVLIANENLIIRKDNYDNLVSYLKTLGGRDVSSKVSRTMKFCMSDRNNRNPWTEEVKS